jgi:hypothetical protein
VYVVLWKALGLERNKVTEGQRKLGTLHTKYYLNADGGACGTMGEKRNSYKVLVGNFEKRDHVEDIGVDGVTVKRTLKN